VVNQDSTNTALTSSVNPSVYGQSVMFTATVNVSSPGVGTPTGTVTFKDGSNTLGTDSLNGSGVATFTTSALSVASHAITAVYGGDSNFTTSTAANLAQTVSPAPLTVTANDASKIYGQPNPAFTASYAGFVLGQDASALGGTLGFSTPATPASHVQAGGYPITPGGLTSTNYAITFVNGTLTITPDPLAITADNKSTVYGAPLPALTASYAGFVNGDTPANLATPVALSTDATASSLPGTYDISASGATSADYLITFSDGTLTINQAGTTTALVSSANPAVFGQSVTFTATVAAVAPGSATPTGSVTFMDGGTPLGTGTLTGGVATLSTASLGVAGNAITAAYGGDGNFTASTSTVLSQAVNQDSTSITLGSSVNPAVFGQPVTFTATVTANAPGAGTPTGTISFVQGSTTLDTESLSTGTTVSFTTPALAVGSATITAVYGGDPSFLTSSASTTETINQASTATTLFASPSVTTSGETVTLTAVVTAVAPGAGTPTGSVQFFVGTTSLGTSSLSGGNAVITTTTLPLGTDSLTAQYLGDADFMVSTSSTVSVTINPSGHSTTTTLSSSANPSVFGQSVTFTATIASSSSGTPTGTVTFFDGSMPLGTATLSSKKASLKTTAVPIDTQSITAVYSGDATFAPSTSTVLTQTVNQDATTTTVTSPTNPSVYGQSVTLKAAVKAASPGSGTPTGTVTFYDRTTSLGTGTLSGGTATLSTAFSALGSHSITAVYGGDTNFTTSTSAALSQKVNQAGATVAVASSANPSVYGQQLTFTVTVSATSPGSGTPTGTITFYAGTTQLGTGTLSGGTASLTTTSPLAVGNRIIKASYGGDTNFKTSTGTLTQVVNQDPTTTSVVSSANPSVYGQSVTFTATVSANAPGNGTPTGSVTFMAGSTTLGTVALSNGTASYSTAKLATGQDSITATYNGSGSLKTSNASLAQTVGQASTSASVTSSLNPSVYGQSVTFTATVSANAPGSGTPTGTVTFYDGKTTLGISTLNSSAKATFKTLALTAGAHSITVVYGGDASFATSNSAVLTQTVSQDSTTTKVSSSANPSVYGQAVTFTATVTAVSPGSGTPTGSVEFYDGSADLGPGTLGSTGTATFTTSTLSVGTHAITGVYSGDTNFTTGTSSAVNQMVNQASTPTMLAPLINPFTSGRSGTFTATISVTSPDRGTPGTATIDDESTSMGTGSVSAGVATFSTSSLSVGTHSIKAVYGGDTNFKTSSSAVLRQVVNRASSPSSLDPAVHPVDVALAALPGETDLASLIESLAFEQVSAQGQNQRNANH
jgi:hypothetical protein